MLWGSAQVKELRHRIAAMSTTQVATSAVQTDLAGADCVPPDSLSVTDDDTRRAGIRAARAAPPRTRWASASGPAPAPGPAGVAP